MSENLQEFIDYRVQKAEEAYKDACLLANEERWNAAINRLYYSAYYITSALLLKNDIQAKTHTGLINQFNLHFIKTERINKELGIFYSNLMDYRQKGDYGDMFDFEKEDVISLLPEAELFIDTLKKFLT